MITLRIPFKTVRFGYYEITIEDPQPNFMAIMDDAQRAEEAYITKFGGPPEDSEPAYQPPRQEPPPRGQQRPPQRQGGVRPQQGGGRGETRATKYAEIEGMMCDICHGPVGRYPRTGNMRSDKAVCLGRCKDGDFIHTVTWLDEDNYDGY